MFSSENLSNVLRSVTSWLQVPVIVVLLLMLMATIVLGGSLIVEFFSTRRKLTANLPELVDELKAHQGRLESVVRRSGLMKRQKAALLEVIRHKELTPSMRESLAAELLYEEKVHFDTCVSYSDVIAKLGPMFGLMGTLIPLGPGIIALGRGDTLTLSQSLLIAFDTTVAGLVAAAVCYVISAIRKKWYAGYLSGLEMCMECVVELESEKTAVSKKAGNRADGESAGGIDWSLHRKTGKEAEEPCADDTEIRD